MADWRKHAACRGMGASLFFTSKGESLAPAKAVCAICPVRLPCAHEGAEERFGIWGGTDARQRRRTRKTVIPVGRVA